MKGKQNVFKLKEVIFTLTGVAPWIEQQPVNCRVSGSIASQGTCQGYRPGRQLRGIQEAMD